MAAWGNQTLATWFGSIATAVGALFVTVGLVLTSCQIDQARQALQATTIYSVEKDFGELFTRRIDEKFIQCYGPRQQPSSLNLPGLCGDLNARTTFYDILTLYRMLLDLNKKGALDDQYVNYRINAFCGYLKSQLGTSVIQDYRQKGFVRADLVQRIQSVCGA
jgi:hypothetical protein